MGFLTLTNPSFTDTAGNFPTKTVERQWAVDFDALLGATMDVHAYYDFLSDGGGINFKMKYGGTSDTDDGTEILTHNSGGSGEYAIDNNGVTRPSGAQILKLLTDSACGDGCGGTARGWTLMLGNTGSKVSMVLDGGMDAALSATTSLIRAFAITPEALPGTGNLSCKLCIFHEADAAASIVVREAGTYDTVDGTIIKTASMTGSVEAQTISFTWTRPTVATQLKVCVEGSSGVNVFGFSLIIQAA